MRSFFTGNRANVKQIVAHREDTIKTNDGYVFSCIDYDFMRRFCETRFENDTVLKKKEASPSLSKFDSPFLIRYSDFAEARGCNEFKI